ncbi:NACHT domain-containing NTPase [Pseudarthrobacter sp. NIBRBAC000502771]|uniref:NACHT domain-containing protein n=1 Tax=Pseudarthrobacter sp. NIBRBAC000502771 TaxID=2590774 RepID=UPI0011328BA4|nr:hypothetical protein [Pseudarthrobacter sp. NIBRBAC000502771]QDG62009.1 hypothetical protein NIBR502771_06570 [Pseudarthrobacter sp. NIBRBAC000502771]
MGYLYENSNAERFQHLCQSLLAADFPKLQCFPVGQPDGGRDGWDPETKTVLQVKFKRADEEENADWLIEALENELPKILRLAKRGAEGYIIATNARGTAHEDVGRIDKVQKWLDENLPIPATCFWRDEIDRRFDSASVSLKLKYSELLSLEDGIEVALGAVFGSDQERQQDAIRGFIAAQFESDKTVKFKQVSLSNDLLDLFIDVPVGFPHKLFGRPTRGSSRDDLRAFFSALSRSDRQFYVDVESGGREVFIGSRSDPLQRLNLGTAEVLLGSAAQEHLRLVVLEGAPGQGKSTLGQYVCQMHRARYLQKQDVLDRVPEANRQTAFRVPLKVDLRDYAAFLEGNSPFASPSLPSQPRTLDVFLAQLIGSSSGGMEFKAHDVLSLLKNAPVLLFLDGLDEVADISAREALVASIGEALARWGEFHADLQVVVTSRPSVFGRAPSFEKFGFVTLTLQNIDSERIYDYANRWVLARGLDESEQRDVRKILSEKLELAHIRDLTRNPMQLTILLSLIHQVGHSLPDQRTDLYSRYVDLFLTREADKSVRVRENRAVLLGFIQHLAWVLQTQAESSKTAGSISVQGLQDLARKYLSAGGHAVEIADDLFGGGLERIFILVERIEGLYEFEVQPLREFYCAQYLYSTAPVGTYRDRVLRGDRAQRFEALAANPFWLNVCRFYAGSCERGETGTLVLSLEEMIKTGDLAVASHARRVGLSLLQDWVFSNVKYPQDQLIRAIFDEDGTHLLIAGEGRGGEELTLDIECGRDTLRARIFEQLKTWPVDIRTSALCRVLRMNGGRDLSHEFCELLTDRTGEDRTYQLIRMFRTGASAALSPERLWQLITEDDPERDQLLLRSSELLWSEPTAAAKIPSLVEEFTSGVLDGLVEGVGHHASLLAVFADLLGNSPAAYMGLRRLGELEGLDLKTPDKDVVPAAVRTFVDAVGTIPLDSVDDTFDQRRSPELWTSIAEIARQQFGDTWATMSLAIRTAGIRTAMELPDGSNRLFDSGVPVCARARAARLRRGGATWWLEQLEHASSSLERRFWAGLVLMWSSGQNLYELASETNAIVDALSEYEYDALRATIAAAASSRHLRADRKKLSEVDLKPFSNRTALLVAVALRAESSNLRYSTKQERTEPLRAFLKHQRDLENIDELPSWKDQEEALAWAKRLTQLRRDRRGPTYRTHIHLLESRLRVQSAEKVLNEPRAYPPELVSRAVLEVQRRYRPKTLATVSNEQDWAFD